MDENVQQAMAALRREMEQSFGQQLRQAADRIQGLEAENRRLGQELQGSLAALPAAIDRMGAEIARVAAAADRRPVLVDTKGTGKPTITADDQEKFAAWVRKFENKLVLCWHIPGAW